MLSLMVETSIRAEPISSEPPPSAAEPVPLKCRSSGRRAILLVDDNALTREILARGLTATGNDVKTAEDGVDALQALSERAFDVVITDILMPTKDGIELIAELRRKFPGIRIIAMSGGGTRNSSGHYLESAQGLGAHAILGKPFGMSELTAAIATVSVSPL